MSSRMANDKLRTKRTLRAIAGSIVAIALAIGLFALPETPAPDAPIPGPESNAEVESSAVGETGGNASDGSVADSGPIPADVNAQGQQWQSAEPDYRVVADDGISAEHQAGIVLVHPAEGLSAEELNAAIAQTECLAPQDVSALDDSLGWIPLALAEGTSVPDAIEQLKSSDSLLGAQANYVYRLQDDADLPGDADLQAASPLSQTTIHQQGDTYNTHDYTQFTNDPHAKNQMVVITTKSREAYLYTHDEHHNPTKWSEDSRPAIAILDTGCQVGHVDLRGNIIDWYDAVAKKDKDNDHVQMTDIDDHGTHVAGIAAACTNNGEGIVGVSFDAKIVPVKVFKKKTARSEPLADSRDILEGYEFVIKNAEKDNIRVVNMSLGSDTEETDNDDKALIDGVDRAYRAGILTTISAGNGGRSGAYWDFPSDFTPNAIGVIDCSVTGVEYDEEGNIINLSGLLLHLSRSAYSNYNLDSPLNMNKPLSALGSRVLSTVPTNKYARKDGTSMASPCVAGVAALALSVKPDLTVDELRSLLYSAADDITPDPTRDPKKVDATVPGFDRYTGFGSVNAYRTVVAADTGAYLTGPTLLGKGATGQVSLSEQLLGTLGEEAEVAWDSSAPDIVSVDESGTVEAKGPGAAIITASYTVEVPATENPDDPDDPAEPADPDNPADPANPDDPDDPANPADPSAPDNGIDPQADDDEGSDDGDGDNTDGGSDGPATTTQTVALHTIVKVYDASISGPDTVPFAQPTTLKVQAQPANGTWKWSSDNDRVTVDPWTGAVSGKAVGESATITASLTANPDITASKVVTVVKADLSKASVALKPASYEYDGKARTPAVTVKLGKVTLAQGTDFSVRYVNNKKVGTGKVIITGQGNYVGSATKTFTIQKNAAQRPHNVRYRTHVQNVGWQGWKRSGAKSGTTGRSLRLEGIRIKLADKPYAGGIRYRTHIQNIGWQGWRANGALSGTTGRSLRLEAIRIQLTGTMAKKYDVYYRVHAQRFGWMGWAKNGASAGTAGYAYRLESIQVKLVPKGGKAPGPTARSFRSR